MIIRQGRTWHKQDGDVLLGLRTVNKDGSSCNGNFVWPLQLEAWVEAPDWKHTKMCGNGLHFLPWGKGDGELLDWSDDAIWLVIAVQKPYVEFIGKGKCKRCRVVHIGDRYSAIEFIAQYAPEPDRIVGYGLRADMSHNEISKPGPAQACGKHSCLVLKHKFSDAQIMGKNARVCTTELESHAQAMGRDCLAEARGRVSCAQAAGEFACSFSADNDAQATGNYSHAKTESLASAAQATGIRSYALAEGPASVAHVVGQHAIARTTNHRSWAACDGAGIASAEGECSAAVAVSCSEDVSGWARAGENGCILLAVNDRTNKMICRALRVGIDAEPGKWYRLHANGELECRSVAPADWEWTEEREHHVKDWPWTGRMEN